MRLLTLLVAGDFHPAVLVGEEVLDLVASRGHLAQADAVPGSMKALLAGGAATLSAVESVVAACADHAIADRLRAAGALAPFDGASLGPVVPDPDLVLSGSMNSHGHLREMGDTPPEHPCAFHKVRSSLAASGASIAPPAGYGDMLDWEGEFCVVIGTRCHRVAVEKAMDHVVGYTLMNDVSAREFARAFITSQGPAPTAQAWERNVLGKNFPGFAPVGPVIATKDELPTPLAYHMETVVNGEVMQSSTQDDLVFVPAEMIAYFSQFYVFEPGDIISMGSPPGVGMARKPPQFLKPGDMVEVRAAGIGSLVNMIDKVAA